MNVTDPQRHATVFLNYRREDSKDVATRLHDDLEYALGAEKVFIDLGSIVPGHPWPQIIRDRLNTATVVLAIIGRDWLKASDPESHQRRLDAEDDWVRLEIEEALRLQKVVIPVLVRDAQVPTAAKLPSSIRELVKQHAITISSEDWHRGVARLIAALATHGIPSVRAAAERRGRSEPSILGVLDYFYRRIGRAAAGEHARASASPTKVNCAGMTDLWEFIDEYSLQKQPIDKAPAVRVQGQLSPYAPLVFGNPMHKRQLHLELRQGAVQLVEELGYEFGDLLNGLLSYSAGQMVIRPHFQSNYVYLGLYESIVRNSIPVMIDREYYQSTVGPLFRQLNCLEVRLQAYLGEIPNYTQEALNDFGITKRLRSILGDQTIRRFGSPNYALFVQGDDNSFLDVAEPSKDHPTTARYLDGDVWLANAANSLITRFIDISSPRDMLLAVTQITRELRMSTLGRGTVSSFDIRVAGIEDMVPDRVLSADQLRQEEAQTDTAGPS